MCFTSVSHILQQFKISEFDKTPFPFFFHFPFVQKIGNCEKLLCFFILVSETNIEKKEEVIIYLFLVLDPL